MAAADNKIRQINRYLRGDNIPRDERNSLIFERDKLQQRLNTLRSTPLAPTTELAGPPAPVQMSKRALDLEAGAANALPAALTKPVTQALMTRAQQLGVDPVAAVATFGIESTFGTNTKPSGKGAMGPMQVTPETFDGIKAWYTNPRNVQRYNIPQQQVDAARAMVKGTSEGGVDAGLLRLKYNEYVGVPKNLWGAAYQAPAESVLKAGRPIAGDDGFITNTEYNNIYFSMYNRAAQLLGQPGLAPVAAATPSAAPAAGVSTAASRVPAAAAAILGQGVAAPAAVPGVAPAAAAPAAVPTTPAAVKADVQRYAANPQAVGFEFQQAQQIRELLLRKRNDLISMAATNARSNTAQGGATAARALAEVDNIDVALIQSNQQMMYLLGMQGLTDLRVANDPRRLAGVLSQYTGQPVNLQPRSDGKYDVLVNGKRTQEGVDQKGIESFAMNTISEESRKTTAAVAAEASKMAIKSYYDLLQIVTKEQAQTIREISKTVTAGEYDLRKLEAIAANKGLKITPSNTQDGSYILQTNDGRLFNMKPSTASTGEGDFGIMSITPINIPGLSVPR
jgi:hypothetical protein